MKNIKQYFLLQLIIFLLIVLFIYTATSKLINIDEFRKQLQKQNLNSWQISLLLWTIPLSEILTALLLSFKNTRYWGLRLAALLMLIFTGYIGLALIGFYEKVPCSCGGVLKSMGWHLHFWFNLSFLSLSIIGLLLLKNQYKNSE